MSSQWVETFKQPEGKAQVAWVLEVIKTQCKIDPVEQMIVVSGKARQVFSGKENPPVAPCPVHQPPATEYGKEAYPLPVVKVSQGGPLQKTVQPGGGYGRKLPKVVVRHAVVVQLSFLHEQLPYVLVTMTEAPLCATYCPKQRT